MSEFFESIKQGMLEAIEYEKGNLTDVKVRRITVAPLNIYTNVEIKAIRTQHNMTQKLSSQDNK